MNSTKSPEQSQKDRLPSKREGTGIYVRIADDLRRQVNERRLGSDAPFPSHRQLAADFSVSLATIQRAVRILVSEGILTAKPDLGLFVTGQESPFEAAGWRRSRKNRASTVVAFQPSGAMDRVAPAPFHFGILAVHSLHEPHTDYRKDLTEDVISSIERFVCTGGDSSIVRTVHSTERPVAPRDVLKGIVEMADSGVDAIALVGTYWSDLLGSLLEDYCAQGVPLVYIGTDVHRVSLPQVYYDGRDGARQAARHLLERGCRDLMFFSTAPPGMEWVVNRAEGARDAMVVCRDPRATLTEHVSPMGIPQHFDEHSQGLGIAFAESVLDRAGLPHGVVASNDCAAIAFKHAAEKRGFTAGSDYLLVGSDDLAEARAEQITSLRRPADEIGREAGKLLADMLNGTATTRRVCVPAYLVVRESSRRALRGPSSQGELHHEAS